MATAPAGAERAGEVNFSRIPTTGEEFRFLETGEDLCRIDWLLPPGGESPMHLHPHQVERVTAVAGELEISWKGGVVVVRPGRAVSIPAGLAHRFRNRAHEPARMVVDFIPALRMREFFESTAGLAGDGKSDRSGRPKNPLLLAVFARQFANSFRVTQPPAWVQALVLGPLAMLGRSLGYRAHQPRHGLPTAQADCGLERLVREADPLERKTPT